MFSIYCVGYNFMQNFKYIYCNQTLVYLIHMWEGRVILLSERPREWQNADKFFKMWAFVTFLSFCQNVVIWSSQEKKLTKVDKIWRSWKSVKKQLFGAVVTHCYDNNAKMHDSVDKQFWQSWKNFQYFFSSEATRYIETLPIC